MKKVPIALLILFSQLCRAEGVDIGPVEEMAVKWSKNEPTRYSYTLKQGGVFGYTLLKVNVRSGQCKAKSKYVFGKSKSSWKRDDCQGNKISDLIRSVIEQEKKGVRMSEIKFDHENGFPSFYSAEPDTELTDQDWYFEVSNYKVK